MAPNGIKTQGDELMEWTLQLRNRQANDEKYAKFRGDSLIGNQIEPKVGLLGDLSNLAVWKGILGLVLNPWSNKKQDFATIAGNVSDYSTLRQSIINSQVKEKYDKMLHPPLTYLGDAFQFRTADGKFNSVISPHLGQAGAPYAKTVPSKTAPLGALPDPSDLFDKLMAREEGGRPSQSGLSSMLIYHATIIIHDIFRTNNDDKNISDSSSYLDLSPLYGYTTEMQRKVRDNKYKLGLLKPDTFAEDRLLRQPPGVCIMLVMYNRYHNYAARQLARINENGRFSVPKKYAKTKLVALVDYFVPTQDPEEIAQRNAYDSLWKEFMASDPCDEAEEDVQEYRARLEPLLSRVDPSKRKAFESNWEAAQKQVPVPQQYRSTKLVALVKAFAKLDKIAVADCNDYERACREWDIKQRYAKNTERLEKLLNHVAREKRLEFEALYDAAWTKLDDDLFNTARLITCGMYIQISVHDYLRALMGFHQFDTNFTLDPRADFDEKKTSRGTGNQVTVEFNLLYRFHCAISLRDEAYTEEYMEKNMGFSDPKHTTLQQFLAKMAQGTEGGPAKEPWEVTFGIKDTKPNTPLNESKEFKRDPLTNLFDDQKMMDALTAAMDEPISNFGPRNVPKCLKAVEIMGIIQARKWEVGTLNDFREFFGLGRHASFESVTQNVDIQNALRDLYEHPDKIELYPGIFCEADEFLGLDPGPTQANSALWTAIFSDAITLVRSDRFYTVDWNTNSLTSWGMKEVTPDNDICKSSVFHRLLQRAFPGWFPYDTIRFFHPFYTAKQNATYAEEQGYGHVFRETQIPEFGLQVATPREPHKPCYLKTFEGIFEALRAERSKKFMNPALYYRSNLPKPMADVLDRDQQRPPFQNSILERRVSQMEPQLKSYFDDLMRYIVMRESVAMTNSTFQIDATRDFAIPVVTRYVADFLGFGDQLRTATDLGGRYDENEIYQHITNCQTFLSYNPDETKMLKRRTAFKNSLAFLTDLTERGTIRGARQWRVARLFQKKPANSMIELGQFIAMEVLQYESDPTKAASILLLICLDLAYNAVVSFTAVLDNYMKELYAAADTPQDSPAWSDKKPKWIKVQELAASKDTTAASRLEKIVQVSSRAVVRLPIVRKATSKLECSFGIIQDGQTVIFDIASAFRAEEHKNKETKANKKQEDENAERVELLTSQLSIAGQFDCFRPKRVSIIALTAMVKFVAQMKNLRRGHDAQGKLKKVNLDSTTEGFNNYMAPMRVARIREQAKYMAKSPFTHDVLKPATDTYLTPNWDEMVPFPMTWKIRFDGFGESRYELNGHPYGRVTSIRLPDDVPPFYQPQGASHFGGSFADTVCICSPGHASDLSARFDAGGDGCEQLQAQCPCLRSGDTKACTPGRLTLTNGCGLGGHE